MAFKYFSCSNKIAAFGTQDKSVPYIVTLFSRALSRRRANLLKVSTLLTATFAIEKRKEFCRTLHSFVTRFLFLHPLLPIHGRQIIHIMVKLCQRTLFKAIAEYSTGIHQEETLFMASYLLQVCLVSSLVYGTVSFSWSLLPRVSRYLSPSDLTCWESPLIVCTCECHYHDGLHILRNFCMIPTFFSLLLCFGCLQADDENVQKIPSSERNSFFYAENLSLRVSFYLLCHHQFHKLCLYSVPFRNINRRTNVVSFQWYSYVVSC